MSDERATKMSEPRIRLVNAGATAYAEACDDWVLLPAASGTHLDAFLAHPDDLLAVMVEGGRWGR